jgi:tetratricopeptide (TPR) repeat protein
MPWKNEIDRIVNRSLADAAKGGGHEVSRALRTVTDLLELAPDRPQSHFHVGTATEVLGEAAAELPASEGAAARWRSLGALDACARRGDRERLQELMEAEAFQESLEHPEGRVALRAVGRMLLRNGQDQRVFDYYIRHLGAVDDEGSRRDAEFLLEEALRRADRYERGERNEEEALARLARAAAFAEDAGLEPRARAKVDRKLGRVHQLAERWEEAAEAYRTALANLPEDDAYRSVLVGDLALATLGVRGTLDLLPQEGREHCEEARRILVEESGEGEGRSYNAIYTLGMLHYEDHDYESAARCFREADQLMRENRAKARIVHARSRFFLGHCLLELGAEGEELEEAARHVQKDAGPSNLDASLKEPVFELLREVAPGARVPGRRGGRRGRGRESGRGAAAPGRGAAAPGREAADYLARARAALEEDPHAALELVDKAFKSRPDFDTWFGAYRTRLDALVALNVRDEALRTYERFRAKLTQRETYDRLESLLLDQTGPLASLLDDHAHARELVDLYEVMADRDAAFVEQCVACAEACLEGGRPEDVACAVAMLREAARRDASAVADLLVDAEEAARAAGLDLSAPTPEEAQASLSEIEEEPHILLIGGDEGRRPHLESFKSLAEQVGFEGSWVFTGSRPPRKALQEIEELAEDSSAILLHPRTDPALRAEIKSLAEEIGIPVREAAWLGAHGIRDEVLRTLRDYLALEVEEEGQTA